MIDCARGVQSMNKKRKTESASRQQETTVNVSQLVNLDDE